MRKYKFENIKYSKKGITLIALIITIVILLILAGITIAQLTGHGLFEKAKLAAEEAKYANAAEKVKLAVNASYDDTGTINDEMLKNNLNDIDGIKPKVTVVTYDLKVTVDGYEFLISKYGQVTALGRNEGLPENTPQTEAGTQVALKEGWGTETTRYIKISDGTEIKGLEKVATVYAVSDGKGNSIPIPYGFYYVGGNLDTGVVISDNETDKYDGKTDKTEHNYATQLKGNQFVWIPCSIENYKKINWGKENAKWDMETNIGEYNQVEKYGGFYVGRYEAGVSTLNETTGKFEDSVTFSNGVSLFNAVSNQTGLHNWDWQNYDYTARQSGTIVTTGSNKATGNIVEKANSIPYYHSDYYTAVEMTRRMYKNDTDRNKYVTSGLVTGTQWDMICKYLQDGGVDVTASDWGNYDNVSLGGTTEETKLRGYYTNVTSGETDGFKSVSNLSNGKTDSSIGTQVILTTGSTEQVKKKNLYDIAGNLWEWTQESSYIKGVDYNLDDTLNSYIIRGGSFNHENVNRPACYRGSAYATVDTANNGFRTVLYIK